MRGSAHETRGAWLDVLNNAHAMSEPAACK